MEQKLKSLIKSDNDKQFQENNKLEQEQKKEKLKIKFLENKINELSQ